MEKILLSDLEGVLLDAEFLERLADQQNQKEAVEEITRKGIKGEIPWEEGLKERIDILKGTDYQDATKIADDMPYMKGAKEFCKELKNRGYTLIGVTGGFGLFSERAKEELGLDFIFSNELEFDREKLSGIKNLEVKSHSIKGLEELLEEGSEEKEIIAVADGANNLKLFEHADKKIAFNAQPIIKENADIIVDSMDLREILELVP